MKIYVASSWRNADQPTVVQRLRSQGNEVYDFREPTPGDHGFAWSDIDPNWQQWTPAEFRDALSHPLAKAGLRVDMVALHGSAACVLVMPCGRSAHLELGLAVGAGKKTAILLTKSEPELMYGMVDAICGSLPELLIIVAEWRAVSVVV